MIEPLFFAKLRKGKSWVQFFGIAVVLSLMGSQGSIRGQTTNTAGPIKLDSTLVQGRSFDLHDVASESDLVGPAKQPEWTTRRVFAETDIYVIPTGEIEYNQFYVLSHSEHEKAAHLFESEFEFGLPWRTQFDVELNYSVKEGTARYDSTLLELPHALADWGKIPLNPAINFGWRFNNNEDDAYVLRLLLAEEFHKRVHFGANLTFDRQIGGERETGYELNAALSYVAIDSKLAFGIELMLEYENAHESLTDPDEPDEAETSLTHETTLMLGPSILFKPTRNTHLSLVPFFGLTRESPVVEAFILFGIDFGPFGNKGVSNEGEGTPSEYRPNRRPR